MPALQHQKPMNNIWDLSTQTASPTASRCFPSLANYANFRFLNVNIYFTFQRGEQTLSGCFTATAKASSQFDIRLNFLSRTFINDRLLRAGDLLIVLQISRRHVKNVTQSVLQKKKSLASSGTCHVYLPSNAAGCGCCCCRSRSSIDKQDDDRVAAVEGNEKQTKSHMSQVAFYNFNFAARALSRISLRCSTRKPLSDNC